MKIEELHEGIKKVIRRPEVDYRTTLTSLPRKELVKSIKVILKNTDRKETKTWEAASLIINQLSICKHDVKHPAFVNKMRNELKKKSKLCVIDPHYNFEAAGIDYKNKKIHPFVAGNPAKKFKKGYKKHLSLEMDSYARKRASKRTMRDLSKKTVTYIKSSQRDKYLVTFIDNKVKIGGKTPKDDSYIFALSADGKMLLAAKKVVGKIHHSSFFGGRAVQCAGVFDIQKGQLKKVLLSSGHYKPEKKHGEQLKKFLQMENNLGNKAKKIPIRSVKN